MGNQDQINNCKKSEIVALHFDTSKNSQLPLKNANTRCYRWTQQGQVSESRIKIVVVYPTIYLQHCEHTAKKWITLQGWIEKFLWMFWRHCWNCNWQEFKLPTVVVISEGRSYKTFYSRHQSYRGWELHIQKMDLKWSINIKGFSLDNLWINVQM